MQRQAGTIVDLMRTCAAVITNTSANVPCFGHVPDSMWENPEAFYEHLAVHVTKADPKKTIRLADPILFKSQTNAWLHLAAGLAKDLPTNPSERVGELRPRVALFCIPGKNSARCRRVSPVTEAQLCTRRSQVAFGKHLGRSQQSAQQDLKDTLARLCLNFYRKIDGHSNAATKQHASALVDAIDDKDPGIGQVLLICRLLDMTIEEAFGLR